MKAATPANEGTRLQALHQYQILDTKREQDYDDLVELAAHLAECPMAVVSLVAEDRQWFKACIGVTEQQTSREISFCAHAILTPEQPLIVPDTHHDARFAENSNVLGGPQIRFYAGFPLVTVAGHALGTLCVMDRRPRSIETVPMKYLATIARQVTQLMELRRVSKGLAQALQHASTLEGLLPICCQCKAIKDETGKWLRLEGYVMARTPAKFTHGFCPECATKLYPEWDLTEPDGPRKK
jgi:GAF domain-containing protein